MRAEDLGRLLLLSALWGGAFLFTRIAVPILGPVVLTESRVLIAGLALLFYSCAAPGLHLSIPLPAKILWAQETDVVQPGHFL